MCHDYDPRQPNKYINILSGSELELVMLSAVLQRQILTGRVPSFLPQEYFYTYTHTHACTHTHNEKYVSFSLEVLSPSLRSS